MTYEEKFEQICNRSFEKWNMPLAELIETENLFEYIPGTLTILEGLNTNTALVPCRGFLILTKDHYDSKSSKFVAEYAVYTEHDADGKPIYNAINLNAVYKLLYICDETFENMAFAIAHASEQIKKETK